MNKRINQIIEQINMIKNSNKEIIDMLRKERIKGHKETYKEYKDRLRRQENPDIFV